MTRHNKADAHPREISIFKLFRIAFIFLLFNAMPAFVQDIRVIDKKDDKTLTTLSTLEMEGYKFVKARDLADALNIDYTQNFETKQFIFLFQQISIIVTAVNPNIIIGSHIKQMPLETLLYHSNFYIPIQYFLHCVQDFIPFQVEFDTKQNILYISRPANTIVKVGIEEKENGLLLRIIATDHFPLDDIYLSETNGWLYVDFYGGFIDTLSSLHVKGLNKKIASVIPFQLSNESARIAFKLGTKIEEKTVYSEEQSQETLVSLRTEKNISQDLLVELEKEREKWKIDLIIIDPGHGGRDPGAIGKNGTYEKKITLEIAKKLKTEIEKQLDVKVLLTRNNDVFLPLERRTKYANQKNGKLFLSIHADSNPHRGLSGHTVYFMGPAKTEEARRAAQLENSVIRFEDTRNHYEELSDASFILAANAQNSFNKESQAFASAVNDELKNETGRNGYGVRQAGFYVLYGASMPNILIETGFLSNSANELDLNNKTYQQKIARAICQGIIKMKSQFEAM
ncbi:N-acetylmuramoyl-L-alanine amidase [candidate division KSB1 bacterium]|nr:N-acetylmuramoyl-L-alanine amidase [candidate division KSB1 bacterium]